MDLSVIIVSFNTKELLEKTIESVINTVSEFNKVDKSISYEIIVSDNNSKDGSVEMIKQRFEQVKIIKNKSNLGFPKGNNIAIKESIGRYILLLNSDTVVLNDCLSNCIKYMDTHMEVGTLGCKIILPNGTLDHACKRGFPSPKASLYYLLRLDKLIPDKKEFGAYTLNYLPEDKINEVDSLSGAFMMVRREVIEKIGILDEDFFMYGEDIDWCYRIKEAGYKVIYFPNATIIHYKGASSKKKKMKTIYEFHRAMYLFYNKHYREKYNFIVTFLVYLGIFIKLILAYLFNLFR